MRELSLDLRRARRLALARAGLLLPERTGLPRRAAGAGVRARRAAHAVVRRFGYLQLDSVAVAGARTHGLVLLSRIERFEPDLAENLLAPGEPLFEYWGHEASWMPLELYPTFAFRRAEFRVHPWWGDLLRTQRAAAARLLARVRDQGPLRALDLEESQSKGWWDWSVGRKVLSALWCAGDLAVRRRIGFQREYDLPERVLPPDVLASEQPLDEALRTLLLRALAGHGWASTGTLSATWRLRGLGAPVRRVLQRLCEEGAVVACSLRAAGAPRRGWIRSTDLDLAETLGSVRPRADRAVLLSPFDPLLWDRSRVEQLFGFRQFLEIYKRPEQRQYGYYCLPVLAGERLIGRVDLRADRPAGLLRVLAAHLEEAPRPQAASRALVTAVERHAGSLGLRLADLAATPGV